MDGFSSNEKISVEYLEVFRMEKSESGAKMEVVVNLKLWSVLPEEEILEVYEAAFDSALTNVIIADKHACNNQVRQKRPPFSHTTKKNPNSMGKKSHGIFSRSLR